MKTSLFASAIALSLLNSSAAAKPVLLPEERAQFKIVERGDNHRLWQRTREETNLLGQAVYRTNSYCEIASGICYVNERGNWTDTKPVIELLGDGAAATNGGHQVWFSANANASNAIVLKTVDGHYLRSRVVGLAYFDSSTDRGALIATVQDSIGLLVGDSEVLYTNSFSGLLADLQYFYTRAGLEQNIVIRESLPPAESFQMNPETTKLQVLTEFFDAPTPKKGPKNPNHPNADQTLDFGRMKMPSGRAFAVGDERRPDKALRVRKSWGQTSGGRSFLIEELPFQSANEKSKGLGKHQGASLSPKIQGQGKDVLSALQDMLPQVAGSPNPLTPSLSPRGERVSAGRVSGKSRTSMIKAKNPQTPGFVMDYALVSTTTDYTFFGDWTYLISDSVYLDGVTTAEGGAVLKADSGGSPYLNISGSLVFETEAYRPFVITTSDEDSFGEPIGGGSPSILSGFMIDLDGLSGGTRWELKHLRVAYCGIAFNILDGSDVLARHCQFLNNDNGILNTYGGITAENVLFAGTGVPLFVGTFASSSHLTVDGYSTFCLSDSGFSSLTFTNSLIIGSGPLAGHVLPGSVPSAILDHSAQLSSGSGVFQTMGGGMYYLTDGSTNRNSGNNGINAELLADLRKMTTYPPSALSDSTYTNPGTLGPVVQRDTGTLARGYHYDCLDWAFGGMELSTNLTFSAGTAVAAFWTYNAAHSIHIADLKTLTFDGRADAPCYWVRHNTVQEQSNENWIASPGTAMITGSAAVQANKPEVKMRFTKCSALSLEPNYFREEGGFLKVSLQDSEFYNAGIGGYVTTYGMTNCLLHRVSVWLLGGIADYFALRNCTVIGSGFLVQRWAGSGAGDVPVTIIDTAFDGVEIFHNGDLHKDDTNWTRFAYNAYLTGASTTDPLGTSNLFVSSFNWQTSWLGKYYLPTNSTLINAVLTTSS